MTNCAGLSSCGNDVHALAGDLVRDRLHARAAHADARADGIDARVVALHRDLGAHARIAGGAEDVDVALADFRHFELEQLDQELRRRAGQEQLRAADLLAELLHFLQERLDAVLRLHLLARDHVRARHEAFGVAAEVDVDAVAVDALHDAADERADAILVRIDHLGALGLAHFLHDDLLRLLGGDAAEGDRFDAAARRSRRSRCRDSRSFASSRRSSRSGTSSSVESSANTFQRRNVS